MYLQHKAVNTDFRSFSIRMSNMYASLSLSLSLSISLLPSLSIHLYLYFICRLLPSILFWRVFVSVDVVCTTLSVFVSFSVLLLFHNFTFLLFSFSLYFFFKFLCASCARAKIETKIEPQETDSMWRRKEKFIDEGKNDFIFVFAYFFIFLCLIHTLCV